MLDIKEINHIRFGLTKLQAVDAGLRRHNIKQYRSNEALKRFRLLYSQYHLSFPLTQNGIELT